MSETQRIPIICKIGMICKIGKSLAEIENFLKEKYILTAAAFGLLGFAISIYTKQVIENRKPTLDKLKCLGFYRSTQPTRTVGFNYRTHVIIPN